MIGFVKSGHKCLKPSFLLNSIPSLILCDEKLLTLQNCKSSLKQQSYTMFKIENTSKVSLKFTSKTNFGRRGVRAQSSRLWTQPTSPPPPPTHTEPGKGYAQANKDAQLSLITPSGLQKRPQMAITSKVSLKLTSRINLGRRDARTKPPTLDTTHKPSLPQAHTQSRKGLSPDQQRPIVPKGTIDNTFRT